MSRFTCARGDFRARDGFIASAAETEGEEARFQRGWRKVSPLPSRAGNEEREREREREGRSPAAPKVRSVSASALAFDNLWRRLAAKPVTGSCERSLAILPLIGTGVTYRRAFTVRQRRCLLRDKLLLAALVRDISRYVWTIGPI